jgi:transitional endoplasmic reticulum ATPase
VAELAKETDNRTGSDIEFVCRKASMFAVREHIERHSAKSQASTNGGLNVSRQHFEQALKMLNEHNGG